MIEACRNNFQRAHIGYPFPLFNYCILRCKQMILFTLRFDTKQLVYRTRIQAHVLANSYCKHMITLSCSSYRQLLSIQINGNRIVYRHWNTHRFESWFTEEPLNKSGVEQILESQCCRPKSTEHVDYQNLPLPTALLADVVCNKYWSCSS
jgi:hypothetical protein